MQQNKPRNRARPVTTETGHSTNLILPLQEHSTRGRNNTKEHSTRIRYNTKGAIKHEKRRTHYPNWNLNQK